MAEEPQEGEDGAEQVQPQQKAAQAGNADQQ